MKTILFTWLVFFISSPEYDYEYIKIINLHRLPIVEVRLNEKKAFFLLDTGSAITMLNQKDGSKYGFKTFDRGNEQHMAIGIGGATTSFTSAYKVKLELGSTRLMTHYMIHDLSHIIAQIKKSSGVEISGILGSDIMKRYGIIIDYRHKRIGVMVSRKATKSDEVAVNP
jgi:hypothetical protein